MEYLDVLMFLGGLFGCWVGGYFAGFIITFIKKLSEKI